MDEAKLAKIEARANAATPGPWFNTGYADDDDLGPHIENSDEHAVALCGIGVAEHRANGDFIAHVRTDVPDLVAEVRRLTAEVEMLRGVGCSEMDGSEMRGPCGVCLKCARRARDEARAALATARREGAEEMREAILDALRYITAEDERAVRALPLDAPGGAT